MTEDFQERANEQGDIVVPDVGTFERALKNVGDAVKNVGDAVLGEFNKAKKEAQAPKPEREVEDK